MTIVLKWKYLHYDIDQLTYRYGKVHTTDEENKELAQTTAENESDTNLVRRLVVTGTARLRRILADYITAKVEDANDTLPTEKTEWSFTFNDGVEADGHALAELISDDELNEDYIIPQAFDPRVGPAVAAAVAEAARKSGVARI